MLVYTAGIRLGTSLETVNTALRKIKYYSRETANPRDAEGPRNEPYRSIPVSSSEMRLASRPWFGRGGLAQALWRQLNLKPRHKLRAKAKAGATVLNFIKLIRSAIPCRGACLRGRA